MDKQTLDMDISRTDNVHVQGLLVHGFQLTLDMDISRTDNVECDGELKVASESEG